MLYLLDANVLIEANTYYYEVGRIPQFWQWLSALARRGTFKSPVLILDEITPSDSDSAFKGWLSANRNHLLLNESMSRIHVDRVLQRGYGLPKSDAGGSAAARVANDAALVSHALADLESRCIVTMERVQDPNRSLPQPLNRRIPLVCHRLGIRCINTFDLIRELDFRIPLANAQA